MFNFIAKHWATFSTVPAIRQEIRRKTRCQCTGRGPAQQKLREQPQLPPNFAPGRLSSLRTPSSCEFSGKKEADCQSWQTNRRKDHPRSDRARQRRVRAPVLRENLSFLLALHEPGPPSLSPPKLDFQLQPIDLLVDPPVVSTVLSDLPADPRRVGPFQGQDGSPEPITQAGVPRQSEVDRVSDSHGDSTGAPPGVSTVELAVSTPVSRRRSDADMESLTRQMADDKAFREQRTKKTEAMLVSFLAKAKGAPPAVLEAWGISPPSQEPSSPARCHCSARATQLGVRQTETKGQVLWQQLTHVFWQAPTTIL